MKLKFFLFFLFSLYYFSSLSQKKPNNNYNTNINRAEKVVNNAGNIQILRADSIYIEHLTINQKIEDSIYFLGETCIYDTSTKFYATTFKFGPKKIQTHFDVNITMMFNKPFIQYYKTLPPHPPNMIVLEQTRDSYLVSGVNGTADVAKLHFENMIGLTVRGIVMADAINITVMSTERLSTYIDGIVGKLE